MTFSLTILLGALAIGATIGVLTGLFGVGGGFLITPMLNILLAVPMPIAVGTGVVQILGVSTAGLYRRRHGAQIDFKLALVLFGGNFVGVRLGTQTLGWLKTIGAVQIGGHSMPAADFWALWVFLALLGGIFGWLLYDTSRKNPSPEGQPGLFAHIHIPPYAEFPSLDHPRLSLPVLSYFGLALGYLTGLLGIGGGVIMLPALVYLVGMRTHRAAATSLVIVWLSSFVATITHASAGNSDLRLAVPLLVGGSIGLQIGVAISARTKGLQLRRYFAFVVLAAIIMVLIKLLAFVF